MVQPDGTRLVVLKAPKLVHLKNSAVLYLFKRHDLVTEDNPQTSFLKYTYQLHQHPHESVHQLTASYF